MGRFGGARRGPVNPSSGARSPAADGASGLTPLSGATGAIDRRRFLIAGTATAGLLTAPSLMAHTTTKARLATATPASIGQWSPLISLGLVSIHAVLLHTGQVLLFSWPAKTVGSAATLWNPVSGSLTNVSLTYERDIFCSGTTVLADGRVFIAGGHLYEEAFDYGVANTTIFDPASNAFTEGPTMSQPRWYPTTVLLPDGSVLIFGGLQTPKVDATTVDLYNPSTNTITTLPASASRGMVTYPRIHIPPTGLLTWTNQATTYYFNTVTSAWTKGPKMISGGRGVTDTAVLLPGLSKIMEIGGTSSTGATNTVEILDTSSSTPAWQETGPMNYARMWANSVLLADGSVLEVGGGTGGSYTDPVFTAERYDPVSAAWTVMAAQTAPRMYHSTAVLLPDGRVLSAGQSQGKYQTTGEVYSPPYLFAGTQPTIASLPATLRYAVEFTLSTPDAASIAGVAMVRPGSVTHSNNFDQRYINLAYQPNGSGGLTVTSPANATDAPPGWYMVFIVNSSGVPSVASWVQLN